MGATIDLMIEFDDSEIPPFTMDIDGVIDFSKSFNIVHSKPYDLMQAISGVRGNPKVIPKIMPRGFPSNMNPHVRKHMDEKFGLDEHNAGWLNYSELSQCLTHASLQVFELNVHIQRVIEILGGLASKYGNDRARLIFGIESA